MEKLSGLSVPNCPECTARERKKIQAKYEADTPGRRETNTTCTRLYLLKLMKSP